MSSGIELRFVKSIPSEVCTLALEDGAYLEVPEFAVWGLTYISNKSLRVGQLVSLEGRLHFADQVFELHATAKVRLSEATPEGQHRIGLHLRQFDKRLWARFLKSKKIQQEHVDTLLKSMKGAA